MLLKSVRQRLCSTLHTVYLKQEPGGDRSDGGPGGSTFDTGQGELTWTLGPADTWGKIFGCKNIKPKQKIESVLPELTPQECL